MNDRREIVEALEALGYFEKEDNYELQYSTDGMLEQLDGVLGVELIGAGSRSEQCPNEVKQAFLFGQIVALLKRIADEETYNITNDEIYTMINKIEEVI